MKTKNLQVTELIQDPRILSTLWKHFQYSIRDLKSYQELTQEEKEIIPESTWNKITES